MKVNILLVLQSIIAVYSLPIDNCDKGPTYWCLNKSTAQECDVTQFCDIKSHFGKVPVGETTDPEKGRAPVSAPVNVSLYYESLCPGCRAMIMNQIFPTYQALKSTGILNIHLYPYGNAYEHKNGQLWEFTCQHGARECRVNLVETCALHLLSPTERLPFIHCLEQSPSVENGKRCADQLGLEWKPIFKCYNGSQGNFLEHQMAVATDALKPSHQYVPWVTANGVHTDEIQEKVTDGMLKYVCSIYAGTKPPACKGAVDMQILRRVEACYKE